MCTSASVVSGSGRNGPSYLRTWPPPPTGTEEYQEKVPMWVFLVNSMWQLESSQASGSKGNKGWVVDPVSLKCLNAL